MSHFSRRRLLVALGAATALPILPACADSRVETTHIDAAAVKAGLADGSITLVDVREPDEWAAGHVEGATLLPLSRFDPARLPPPAPGKTLVIMCRSGNRSQTAIALAQKAGRSDVKTNFAGGISAWVAAGGRTVR